MAMETVARTSRTTRYLKRFNALKTQRATWEAHWKDLGNYLLPRRVQWNISDHNNGRKVNENIINSTPLLASRTLSAGMMAGITSPARPWFRLSPPEPSLAEVPEVRSWLNQVEERIREAIAKSNIYNVLPSQYQDLGVFGVSPIIVDEDDEDGIRAYVIPMGTYVLATSARQRVDTLYREFKYSVGNLVEKFKRANCSQRVLEQYDRGELDVEVEVLHIIEPNRERDPSRKDYKGKPWSSCWMEKSVSATEDKFLRESGYDEFPVMAPRWDVTGQDVYGRCPGMDALGDAKALQLLEKRKLQMVDKIVTPPVNVPSSMRHSGVSLLPGAPNYVDGISGGLKVEPAIVIDSRAIEVAEASISKYEERINAAFYADLWLMLAQSDRRQITATEVEERHEEKMLQLGPVLERLQDELLDPLIDRIFGILLRRGELPQPPEAIQGADLRVEYISIMAQAQKLLSTAGIERLAGFVGNLVGASPEALDKLNVDEVIDEYGSALGVKPDLVRSDEEVAVIRKQRAQQQQMAQAAEAAKTMQTAAQGAKTMSETDTSGSNALTQMLSGFGVQGGGVA
jgi:hypothetical protein